MTAAAPAPELVECDACEGSGELPCCTAYDVAESGPRGCRCAVDERVMAAKACDRERRSIMQDAY